MHSKTLIRTISILLLAIAISSTCCGADLPKFSIDLTKALNERWDERMLSTPKQRDALVVSPPPPQTRFYPPLPFFCSCGGRGFTWEFVRSKFLFTDSDVTINNAFLSCTLLRILTLETTAPVSSHLAGTLKDNLYEGFLILNRTETKDVAAMRLAYRMIVEFLEPEEMMISAETIQEEIAEFRPSQSPASIILDFDGENSIRVEIFIEKQRAIIRTKDQWGGYTFDRLSAIAIEARVKDLQSLYTSPPADD